jgi:cytochrome o ubiquinol oxidase operon protein cyoD
MNQQPRTKSQIKSYVLGFIFSILLTLAAYLLVQAHINSHHEAISHEFVTYSIFTLAVIQLIVQGIFFLHLGKEANPRWNLLFFLATIGIVLTVVISALWIMSHLNYNMTPKDMDHAIIKDEGIKVTYP